MDRTYAFPLWNAYVMSAHLTTPMHLKHNYRLTKSYAVRATLRFLEAANNVGLAIIIHNSVSSSMDFAGLFSVLQYLWLLVHRKITA